MTAAAAALAILTTLGVGIAFGGKLLRDLHIWIPSTGGGHVIVSAPLVVGSLRITAKSLRETIARSPFRVVLPTGLPQGARLHLIFTVSGANGGALMLDYSYPITGRHYGSAVFLLVNRALNIDPTTPSFMRGVAPAVVVRSRQALRTWRWLTGDETVVLHGTLTGREAAHVRRSMVTMTPQDALAATISMTGEIVPVGAPVSADRASRFRRPGITGYLIDGTMVPSFVRILQKNAAQPLDGSNVDVQFRHGARYVMKFRSPGGPYRLFGAAVPKGTTYESIAAHNILAIENALRVKPLKATMYDFLVYQRDASCDSVWALPRALRRGAVESYTVSASKSAATC
jgi:hypothetical protein